jgi:hypothetical protein
VKEAKEKFNQAFKDAQEGRIGAQARKKAKCKNSTRK